MYTYAAQTVQAQRTRDFGTPRPTMTYTGPIITLPAGGTPLPTDTSTPPGGTPPYLCNLADFIGDVSIPDDTPIKAGTTFTKTWRIANAGTCTWVPGYTLVFSGGDALGAPGRVPLNSVVPPGSSVDISVQMLAPSTPGSYQGDWKMRDATGIEFGFGPASDSTIWVRIQVLP